MRPWPETLTVPVTRAVLADAESAAADPVFASVSASVSLDDEATADVVEDSVVPDVAASAAYASRIDFAIGWVLMPSARAAMRRSSVFSTPGAGRTSDTWKLPSVRVPVLSDTTVWRCESSSR